MPSGPRRARPSGARSSSTASCSSWISEARVKIEQVRLLVLKTAWLMDTVGNRGARIEVSAIKVAAPEVGDVGDRPRDPGARRRGRVSRTCSCAELYAVARILQIADGPDEVHHMAIARRESRADTARKRSRPDAHGSVSPHASRRPASPPAPPARARGRRRSVSRDVQVGLRRASRRPSDADHLVHAMEAAAAAGAAQRSQVVGGRLRTEVARPPALASPRPAYSDRAPAQRRRVPLRRQAVECGLEVGASRSSARSSTSNSSRCRFTQPVRDAVPLLGS